MTSLSPDTTISPQSSILLRNRENQRASRARRKGYIEDLEKRVRDFERDGAAATLSVQSAARKVAEENFWLRHMLSTHGITKNEVDEYVEWNRLQVSSAAGSSGGGAPPVQISKVLPQQRPSPPRKRKHSEMSARELEAARTLGQIDSPVRHGPVLPPWEAMQSPKVSRQPLSDLPTPEDSYGSEQEHTTSSTSPELRDTAERHSLCQSSIAASASASAYPEIQTQTKRESCTYDASNHPRQTDVTPCEEAAQIIASMRGHEDAEAVWPELGCSLNKKCTVTNMTIFQLSDMAR
jgi:hypothetical protein